MNEKDFSLSVGVYGTLFGYDAAAAYIRRRGKNCFQGRLSINRGSADGLISQLDKSLYDTLCGVLPNFLPRINADISFSISDDHRLFSVDTDNLKFTAITLKGENAQAKASGFLCAVSEKDCKSESNGIIADLIVKAKNFIGIDNFYFCVLKGSSDIDIGRLLNPFGKKEAISPPAKLFNGEYCLYTDYEFSETRGGVLDKFLGELLGIKSLAFFAGKDRGGAYYFALSLPRLSNNFLSVEDLILKFTGSSPNYCFEVSGALALNAFSDAKFALDCTLSPKRVMLSAAFVTKNFVNFFGDFCLGDAVLTIGYGNGLTFGILGEIQLRELFMFGAVQLAFNGCLNVQMISLATGKLTISSLVKNIVGLNISGIDILDSILCIDYFKINFEKKFDPNWLNNGDITEIISFFNKNIGAEQLRLEKGYVAVKKEPHGGGYYLTDKFNMRHYYIDAEGNLSLRPQIYFSAADEPIELANGMEVKAGFFFCAEINVLEILSLKVLFSFFPNNGALAFGMLSEIDLGIIKISSSEFKKAPVDLPENSALKQFLDISQKGVVFFLQMSSGETSFYFDGMISIAGLLKCQARLSYQMGFISINTESTLCGMTTEISLYADYRSFKNASFSIAFSFNTYKLEETLTAVKDCLTRAVEVCREKIGNAEHSLQDAKIKVRKLYGEIDALNERINDCRIRLDRMNWWKRVFYAPVIGCEIAGFEIAKAAIYASIAIAEAALAVAQAAVRFAGTLGEGVLKLVHGVINSVTSLFFIRRLNAKLSADVNDLYMRMNIEFIALGKEYNHNWKIQKKNMGDIEKVRAEISDTMLNLTDQDVKDLENGVVSSERETIPYANVKGYFEQPTKISDAAKVLEQNIKITQFVLNSYVENFGEEPPDFDEIHTRLLENIGIIKANISISERLAALSDLQETADQLQKISESANDSDCSAAAEAVNKYNSAVALSNDLQVLMGKLDETKNAVISIRDERSQNVCTAVQSRGINGKQYHGSMYEYAKGVREEVETVYKNLPQNGYINLWNDNQIRSTIQQAEVYFMVDGR